MVIISSTSHASSFPDFTIQRLGKPDIESPIQLSRVLDDYIANYVEDDERILFDNSLSGIQGYHQRNEIPPSYEAAGPRDRIFFDPKAVRAAIVTCGGLCPGVNDVIQGIVHSLSFQYHVESILGIQYGYKGLVRDSGAPPIVLTPKSVAGLHTRGGTLLGSSRGPQNAADVVDFMLEQGINVLFTIGGDGTQRGAQNLVDEIGRRNLNISVIGLPKTIDNDIRFIERSFGFETAYSIAQDVLNSAHAEAEGAFNGVTIVKLMGRHSGFLSAMASVSSGDVNFCLIPEIPFKLKTPGGFLAALERRLLVRHHAVVVVAEGAGQNLLTDGSSDKTDASGNAKLDDIGQFLHHQVKDYFKLRGIEAGVRYIDPSYYVRSQPAIPTDRLYCLRLAYNAVHAAMSGRTGMMVGYWNSAFTHLPIEAAVSGRKVVDPESDLWLSVLEMTGQPNRMI